MEYSLNGTGPTIDIAKLEKLYLKQEREKEKKKKNQSKSKGAGSIGLSIACGVAGGLASRGLKYLTMKFAPIDDDMIKRAIANTLSVLGGGSIALVVKNEQVQNFACGMAADGIIEGGVMLYEKIVENTDVPVNQLKSSVNGTSDDDVYYEDAVEGTDDYTYDEPLVVVNYDVAGMNPYEKVNVRDYF
jgi:hypothetical protein